MRGGEESGGGRRNGREDKREPTGQRRPRPPRGVEEAQERSDGTRATKAGSGDRVGWGGEAGSPVRCQGHDEYLRRSRHQPPAVNDTCGLRRCCPVGHPGENAKSEGGVSLKSSTFSTFSKSPGGAL